jgi:hypothetical protein
MIEATRLAGDEIAMNIGRSDGTLEGRPAPGDGDSRPQPVQAPGTDGPVNGLELWDSEEPGEPIVGPLDVVQLTQEDVWLAIFTVMMHRVYVHYLKFKGCTGYSRCDGDGCLPCRLGVRRELRDLLPVFDVTARVVAILPIGPGPRPQDLRPQLTPVLRRLAAGEGPLLISVRREDYRVYLNVKPLPPDVDDGAEAIRAFRARLEAGRVNLADSLPHTDDPVLMGNEAVRTLMSLRGIRP